jgi:DNA-binding LacI/PurR family transcriptional regulator
MLGRDKDVLHLTSMAPRPASARANLVAFLTQSILARDSEVAYALSSEHELCRQFQISRVTVRLALGDLENRGLIYRRHGKGTFAHGKATRIYRNIAVVIRSTQVENRSIAELVRGVSSAQREIGSGVMLVGLNPAGWRPELASSLSGVIVCPWEVNPSDLSILQERKLPFILVGESELSGPRLIVGEREAARRRTDELLKLGHRSLAIFAGLNPGLDVSKRLGVHDAMIAAGHDPATLREFSATAGDGTIFSATQVLLDANPRPTAVLAFDDSLASMLSFKARLHAGLRVPEDLSIASFHQWSRLAHVEPELNTVHFDFFAAGQKAAEALNRAAHTGEPVADLRFEPTFVEGATVGPVPKS